MTVPQFKYLLQPGALLDSFDRKVNIAYTGSYIQAIAVRITQQNLVQLQQATSITLRVPSTGTTLNVPLESSQVPLRTVDREQVGNYYLYTILEQDQLPKMETTPTPSGTPSVEEYFTEVIILPKISGNIFNNSEYDVALNNVMDNKLSKYVQISDRGEQQTTPTNLESILKNTAILASTQDSNYSDTGWIRGRYLGTSTQADTFGGIDPAVNGSIFQGTIFPVGLSDEEISTIISEGVTYSEYFYNGQPPYPKFNYILTDIAPTTGIPITPTTTTINLTVNISGYQYTPEQGDILLFNISSPGSITDEYMKVLSYRKIGGTSGQVTVERGWGGSIPRDFGDNAEIYRILPIQVYEVANNKLQSIQKSKIYVKDSREIIPINNLGYVVTGSII